jgi:hypothetical protein
MYQMLHILAPQQRRLLRGVAVFGPASFATPLNLPPRNWFRSCSAFAAASACGGQHMLVHFAPMLFRASVNAVATTSVAVALINSQCQSSDSDVHTDHIDDTGSAAQRKSSEP